MPWKFLVSPHRVTLSPPFLHQTISGLYPTAQAMQAGHSWAAWNPLVPACSSPGDTAMSSYSVVPSLLSSPLSLFCLFTTQNHQLQSQLEPGTFLIAAFMRLGPS